MEKNQLAITTDCVCDLPDYMLEKYGVDLLFFYITTEKGCFQDRSEITSLNVLEHLSNGGEKAKSDAPSVEEYRRYFEKRLRKCHSILHITISSGVSHSFERASEAAKGLEGVYVFDSYHLSTGLGFFVIKACEMRDSGENIEDIITALISMRDKVSTSFLARDADQLHKNGLVSKKIKNVCSLLKVHPVLMMDSHGCMKLKNIQIGSYSKSISRYVRDELKNNANIDKSIIFITHAGCSVKTIDMVKEEIKKYCSFDCILVTSASATITCNCGGNTLGVLFVHK